MFDRRPEQPACNHLGSAEEGVSLLPPFRHLNTHSNLMTRADIQNGNRMTLEGDIFFLTSAPQSTFASAMEQGSQM